MKLLEIRDLDVRYGHIQALKGVSLDVAEGEIVALLGANGAGKTTLMRTISGLLRPHSGQVLLRGSPIQRTGADAIVRLGVSQVPEGRRVFPTLSVLENLRLGAYTRPASEAAQTLEQVWKMFPRLLERREQLAGTLSGGEQRMLSLAKVFAVPQRLLVVDEASFGLSPAVVDEVFDTLRTIRDTGTSLLVIEQHLDRVLSMSDRAVVLVRGRVAAEGTVADVEPAIERLLPAHPQWSA